MASCVLGIGGGSARASVSSGGGTSGGNVSCRGMKRLVYFV